MKYSIETLKEIARHNIDVKVKYFWGHTPNPQKITAACLSQWYDCRFEVDGVIFHTTEQYMMAEKARLFGDEATFSEIMSASTPSEYKQLGRKVSGFVAELWDAKKYDIVVKGNKAKFSQNHAMKEFLLSTGDAILAEASPFDKIWGIGLDKEHAETGGMELWQGENLLGCALMEVRDWLKEEE
ncbi:MAG: NADAR family protein [Muribaculaceae bacterium]